MMKIYKFFVFTLIFAFASTSIQGQEYCEETGMECECPAYVEGSRTAHWSIYVPIAIIVAAAIWFGIADRNDCKSDYYYTDSQDALGSIDNSKRHSNRSGSCSSYSFSRYCRSKSAFGHN
jgi:hypothetical protein